MRLILLLSTLFLSGCHTIVIVNCQGCDADEIESLIEKAKARLDKTGLGWMKGKDRIIEIMEKRNEDG